MRCPIKKHSTIKGVVNQPCDMSNQYLKRNINSTGTWIATNHWKENFFTLLRQ